jgi:GT2 family glycosyltransferase
MVRLSNHGDIYHAPDALFHHELGASSEANRWWAVACYNRGKELYFAIHRGKAQAVICFYLNRSGALLRMIVYAIATVVTLGTVARFRKGLATFFRVLFAPADPYKKAPWTPRKP